MTGIEWVYIAVAVASAAAGAYSSYQQGKAAEAQAESEANMAKARQKQLAEQADMDVTTIRSKYRRIRGAQKAAAAASGRTLDGSLTDLFFDTNLTEDLEVMQTLYKGKTMALSEQARANFALARGQNAVDQANMNAVGSILSATGSAVGNYPTLN